MKKDCTYLFLSFLLFFSTCSFAENINNSSNSHKKDGEILETILMIDTNEINAAQQALKKASDNRVKSFAQEMITDHTQNGDDITQLRETLDITLISSDISDALKEKGIENGKKLSSTSHDSFDKVYMKAMIKDHGEALKLIDHKLLPQATEKEVLAFLRTTRDTVNNHLKMAKAIYNNQ